MNSNKIKLSQALVRWNRNGDVFVQKLQPMLFEQAMDFWTTYHAYPENDAIIVLFADAMAMICRDKCDPMKVHNALMLIEEYADVLATDMEGTMNEH